MKKKKKSIESIVRNTKIIEAMIESVQRAYKVDKEAASKIVEMRFNSVLSSFEKSFLENKIQLNMNPDKTNLSDMSIDEIINSDKILKEK